MTSHNLRRLAAAAATFSLSFTASAAINSAAIVSSTLSPQCLEYKSYEIGRASCRERE